MEDGTLLESALSSSSEVNKWHSPNEARLNNYKGKNLSIGVGVWCADKDKAPHYLQIDLGSPQYIGKIATQGRNNTSNQFVKSYNVRYSQDGSQFDTIGDPEKVFTGNIDKNSVVFNDLPGDGQAQSIHARYFRILPVDYNINICIRVELYKCPAPTTQPPVTTPLATTNATQPPVTTPPACPECAHGCVATPEGHNCTCPSGFRLHMDGKTCEDINECSDGTHSCGHNCSNTNGSYTCSCMPGYKLQANGKSCEDIDECSETPHGCTQKCVNIPGSFECDCNPGYKLGGDGKSCSDIDECSDGTHSCDHDCSNTVGSYTCSCMSGYKLQGDGKSCQDINECSDGTHSCDHDCSNTGGSYTCSCRSGYRLLGDGKSCQDNDECALGTDQCDESTTECLNKIGTYECPCLAGYKRLTDYRCTDINECTAGTDQCDISTTVCENTVGDYQCNCRNGYEADTKLQCKDKDECQDNNGGCSHGCSNNFGSYTCTCPDGYQLDSSSSRNCVDINECTTGTHQCDSLTTVCENTVGDYQCNCRDGYEPDTKLQCKDIDECVKGTDSCDRTSTTCKNVQASYECNCKVGYTPIVGDNLKCKPNTCPALTETTGTKVSPASCLQNNVRVVGDTCEFSCEPGYELPSQQSTSTCQPSGSWDPNIISCQRIRCPKLNAPANGDLFPPECETSGNYYQEKCHYSCNNGYDLNGVSDKTCGSNGQWDDQTEPTCILAVPDPWITCPGSVIVTLSPGASTFDVSALLDTPESNQPQSSIEILPEQYSNKIFPVGTTTITYRATNPVNKIAECQTSVLVQDKEAPKIIDCPMNIYETRDSGDQAVSWTAPRITDNVGIASNTSSDNPGDTFQFGETIVNYKAVDSSGNSASCSFKVVLQKLECAQLDQPNRGTVSCGDFCSFTCDSGTQQFEAVFFLTCSKGQWSGEVPDCVDFMDPDANNACPAGYVKQGGLFPQNICVKCPMGRYYEPSNKTCTKCPVGYISTAEASPQCEKCPTNSSTIVEGSKQCIAQCLPGTFSASGLKLEGALVPCDPCPSNTYQNKVGQSGCERCPNDTQTVTNGSTSVSDCGGPPVVTYFGPNPTDAMENKQAQFECHGEGLPRPSYVIGKVNPAQPPEFRSPYKLEDVYDDGGLFKGIRYIMTKVTEYDDGPFNCTVTNRFGSDTKYLHVNVTLDFSIGKRRRR